VKVHELSLLHLAAFFHQRQRLQATRASVHQGSVLRLASQ